MITAILTHILIKSDQDNRITIMKPTLGTSEYIFSVSEFVDAMRVVLQDKIGEIKIQGEVTDFRPRQGNLVFFELKDETSRILCFMMSWELLVPLEDGMEVLICGTPSLFKRSGKFHLKVSKLQLVGEGALARALELLKKKLEKEGLFAMERKRPLPRFPQRIGLITSPEAAAYTDVLRILKNRWSGLNILFYPVSVQGAGSEIQIQEAFEYFNQARNVEIIILTRGGGSLEDLQSFNSEAVARAIFASKIPVICGVGHERDVTIADLVADVRASTPSNAAERAVPDKKDVLFQVDTFVKTIEQEAGLLIEDLANRIGIQTEVLEQGVKRYQERFLEAKSRLKSCLISFQERIRAKKENLVYKVNFLSQKIDSVLNQRLQKIASYFKILNSLSPQKVLSRGYSLAYNSVGKIIRSAEHLKKGQLMTTRFYKGKADSKIIKTSNE